MMRSIPIVLAACALLVGGCGSVKQADYDAVKGDLAASAAERTQAQAANKELQGKLDKAEAD